MLDSYAVPIAFEEQVLASIVGLANGLKPDVRARAAENNLIPIRKEVDQVRARRAAWLRQRRELES